MSVVNSPTSQAKDRFSNPIIIDDSDNDAERQLCGAVDAMLASVSRVLQQSANERNAKVKVQGATTSFLRANGIRIAQENDGEDTAADAAAAASAGNNYASMRGGVSSGSGSAMNNSNNISRLGGGSDAEATLRTQLELCRDLLRKVDSERRHLRKRCAHLQGEQDQRRTEVEAVHRYSVESHQRSLTLEHHIAEERQRRRHLEEQLDTQTQELMQLRRVLRALPGNLVASLNSPQSPSTVPAGSSSMTQVQRVAGDSVTHPLVPDRRFEEAFKDKMNSIVYKRRYRQASALHQAASEQLEALRMEQLDPQSAGVRWSYASEGVAAVDDAASGATTSGRNDATSTEDTGATTAGAFAELHGTGTESSTAATLASAVFWQSALDFPFQLPFSTATPQDALIKSLIYRSRYAEPLTQLREHTLRLSSRLKTTQDSGLRTLYMTFNQALQRVGATGATQTQSRALYERQMDKMQRAHRELLYSLIEQVNAAATAIPELEHGSRGFGSPTSTTTTTASGAAQRRDVGCSAQDSVSVEEYRASQLREQLTKVKLQSLEAAAAALQEREATAARCTAARQDALQALQSLKKLTTGVVRAVQSQRGAAALGATPSSAAAAASGEAGAGEGVYDPLEQVREPITEDVLDDPRLVTKMAEATDLTLTYIRRLARLGAVVPPTQSSTAGVAKDGLSLLSPPRSRTNLATSARLSSTLTFDTDTTREATYGHIIDIHRRGSASPADAGLLHPHHGTHGSSARLRSHLHGPPSQSGRSDRRQSAPASLNATLRRPRSRSAAGAAATRGTTRRQTVPQLPTVAKTPTAPTTKRGARGGGRPERGDGVVPPLTPPVEEAAALVLPSASLTGATHETTVVSGIVRDSPAKLEGRSPNPAVSVIELGFSENNIRYT